VRWLFWLIALFALASAVALGAHINEGYVLLVFPPWRVEISLNLLLIALALLFFFFYGLLRALSLTLGLPRRAREFREHSGRQKAMRMLEDALRMLLEGRFGQALKKAEAAHDEGTLPGLAALLAARAAQRLREAEKLQRWSERARLGDPKCEAAALMLAAEFHLEHRRYHEALTALKQLQLRQGRHLAALRLELQAQQGVEDWDEVLRLSRQLEKRAAIPPEAAHEIRVAAHQANIRLRSNDLPALLAYRRTIPEREQDGRLALALAEEMHRLGHDDLAAETIEKTLERGSPEYWYAPLVAQYGQLAGQDLIPRIARAEKWLLGHPQDADLLLALGRLCRRQRLWGKAQAYLEAALSVRQDGAVHLELAGLFDELDRVEEANRHFRLSVNPRN